MLIVKECCSPLCIKRNNILSVHLVEKQNVKTLTHDLFVIFLHSTVHYRYIQRNSSGSENAKLYKKGEKNRYSVSI